MAARLYLRDDVLIVFGSESQLLEDFSRDVMNIFPDI